MLALVTARHYARLTVASQGAPSLLSQTRKVEILTNDGSWITCCTSNDEVQRTGDEAVAKDRAFNTFADFRKNLRGPGSWSGQIDEIAEQIGEQVDDEPTQPTRLFDDPEDVADEE